jgi:hypothetical protein
MNPRAPLIETGWWLMISLATGYFRFCRPADRPPKKVAWARQVELVQWRSQPGMAGQGDTGAAEQSSRPLPVGGFLCHGGGGGRRGRHPLDLGACTRVGGGVCALWFPAPDAPVGSDAVADADPAVGATTVSRAERFFPSHIYACRKTTPAEGGHRQEDGGGTERAVGHP